MCLLVPFGFGHSCDVKWMYLFLETPGFLPLVCIWCKYGISEARGLIVDDVHYSAHFFAFCIVRHLDVCSTHYPFRALFDGMSMMN